MVTDNGVITGNCENLSMPQLFEVKYGNGLAVLSISCLWEMFPRDQHCHQSPPQSRPLNYEQKVGVVPNTLVGLEHLEWAV